jgi:uncharacterized protein (DUF305 family)
MITTIKWTVTGIFLAFGLTAFAQMDPNMKMDSTPPTNTASSGSSFMQDMDIAMKKMDHDMANAPMNGNADHDFVTMMIPHHQGAVDMAKGELKYGKDPAMRKFAEKIIKDQQAEIDMMNEWLKKHPNPATK